MHLSHLLKTLKAFPSLSAADKKLLKEWEEDHPHDMSCSTAWPGWVRLGILKDDADQEKVTASRMRAYWRDYHRYGMDCVAMLAKVPREKLEGFLHSENLID